MRDLELAEAERALLEQLTTEAAVVATWAAFELLTTSEWRVFRRRYLERLRREKAHEAHAGRRLLNGAAP